MVILYLFLMLIFAVKHAREGFSKYLENYIMHFKWNSTSKSSKL